MAVLGPIWRTKPETASRLRGRIEAILDWATVSGLREGDNPARWRGHLSHLLPPISKVRAIKHHAAMTYSQLPAFVAQLRQQPGVAARALEFTILTAARTGEVIGARQREINLREGTWTIPGVRMKAGTEHRVPLAARALELLCERPTKNEEDYLFNRGNPSLPLSNMAMLKVLSRMGLHEFTVHGFRSTFRDWAAELTYFQRDVIEMALAHTIGSKVEAAYRRGDLFEKRRQLMKAWGSACEVGGDYEAAILPFASVSK